MSHPQNPVELLLHTVQRIGVYGKGNTHNKATLLLLAPGGKTAVTMKRKHFP